MKDIDPAILSIGISNHDLCTRCGTCVGACPTEAITLDEQFFPKLIAERCTECAICGRTCPGARVNCMELAELTFGERKLPESFDGHVIETLLGHAGDEGIRGGGAGGGVITALMCDLLKHGDVDGCIVARMNHERPWIGEYFIARSYEDLLESQGSRYMIIPMNSAFAEIRKLPGRYAYAALPCQVHGFRLLAREDEELSKKIHCVIGLFCGGSLEPNVVTELLQAKGLKPGDIKDFQFRGGEWPGKIRAILKTGEIVDMHYSNYKDGAYNYFINLYMPRRCQTCVDGSGLFSDVSISDAWTRGPDGEYRFRAHSRLLVRTPVGAAIVKRAVERGSLVARDVTRDPDYVTHRAQTGRKRINTHLRAARLRRKGKPASTTAIPAPEATLRDRMNERFASFLLWLGRSRWIRYVFMKFITSSCMIPIIKVRSYLKRRKYRKMAEAGL